MLSWPQLLMARKCTLTTKINLGLVDYFVHFCRALFQAAFVSTEVIDKSLFWFYRLEKPVAQRPWLTSQIGTRTVPEQVRLGYLGTNTPLIFSTCTGWWKWLYLSTDLLCNNCLCYKVCTYTWICVYICIHYSYYSIFFKIKSLRVGFISCM